MITPTHRRRDLDVAAVQWTGADSIPAITELIKDSGADAKPTTVPARGPGFGELEQLWVHPALINAQAAIVDARNCKLDIGDWLVYIAPAPVEDDEVSNGRFFKLSAGEFAGMFEAQSTRATTSGSDQLNIALSHRDGTGEGDPLWAAQVSGVAGGDGVTGQAFGNTIFDALAAAAKMISAHLEDDAAIVRAREDLGPLRQVRVLEDLIAVIRQWPSIELVAPRRLEIRTANEGAAAIIGQVARGNWSLIAERTGIQRLVIQKMSEADRNRLKFGLIDGKSVLADVVEGPEPTRNGDEYYDLTGAS